MYESSPNIYSIKKIKKRWIKESLNTGSHWGEVQRKLAEAKKDQQKTSSVTKYQGKENWQKISDITKYKKRQQAKVQAAEEGRAEGEEGGDQEEGDDQDQGGHQGRRHHCQPKDQQQQQQ